MTAPTLPSALIDAVQHSLEAWCRKASETLQQAVPPPPIHFDLKGKSAGQALLQPGIIRLNPILLLENQTEYFEQVIPHELAHLLTYQCFGRVKPHGAEWQYMMEKVLGIPAITTHKFDVQSVQGKLFNYRCQCRSHQLTIRRHNKIVRQQAQYYCRYCQQPLTPT